jgi:hypothetical protein
VLVTLNARLLAARRPTWATEPPDRQTTQAHSGIIKAPPAAARQERHTPSRSRSISVPRTGSRSVTRLGPRPARKEPPFWRVIGLQRADT